ncbi:MAG: radical SAM protein [Clostridia bacterium]|nr:radical SAM protein [Clostridia bacterium]
MKKQKVCWKITTKCNQNCKYCFGFSNIKELTYDENEKVLNNLKKNKVTNITWTGGEAVLYPRLNELIKSSKSKGIKNKLVTNGIFLAENNSEYVEDILNSLDEINLSIDSISNDINVELGKEENHLEIIKKVLEKAKNKKIKVGINTVVSKLNINYLQELGNFLNNYNIEKWKFLKFMPIRERSLEHIERFEVGEEQLEDRIKQLEIFKNIKVVQYKKQAELEKSPIILPNADIILTQNGKDNFLGNALLQDKITFAKENSRIKVLVAHNSERIRNAIISSISDLGYIDVVGVASNGIDTYNQIIGLRPEMVFAEYNFSDMPGLELIKKTKKELKDNFPSFNTIGEIPDNELVEAINITGDKINACVIKPYDYNAKDIAKAYKEYNYQ